MPRGGGVLGLVAAMAALCLLAGASLVTAVLVPLLVMLAGAEIERDGARIGRGVVGAASLLLPRQDRRVHRDEWIDHLSEAGDRGMRPLLTALSIAVLAAPLLAVLLRYGRQALRPKVARLSTVERSALAGLARGEDVREIARNLGVGRRMVRAALRSARRRLGARTREEAVAIALTEGILDDGQPSKS